MAPPAAPRGSTAGGPSLQIVDEPFLDLSENRRLVTVLFADLSGSIGHTGRHCPFERRLEREYGARLALRVGISIYAVRLAPWEWIGNPWGIALSPKTIGEVHRSRGDQSRAIAS